MTTSPRPLELLENYRLIRSLGQGAYGEVWLASDTKHRSIALKFLKADQGQKGVVERFKQEFALLTELRHRYLARVFDFGISPEGNRYFFTQEFCPGRNFILAHEDRPISFFEQALVQVLSALDYIHSMGVIHFDIKAENIIVGEEGGKPEVKLLDFGIAARLKSGSGSIGGTPRYMAPELQTGRRNLDHRLDLYSLGMLGLRTITGRFPFPASTLESIMEWHRRGRIPGEVWRGREIPRYLRDIIEKMLEKNPADRFSTAGVGIRFLNMATGKKYSHVEEELRARLPTEGPLVGREKILEDIRVRLDEALSDSGSGNQSPVFVVRGERGSGKSRLLNEILRIVELREIFSFYMACDRLHPGWEELVRGLGFPQITQDNPDESWRTRRRIDAVIQTSKKRPFCLLVDDFEKADREMRLFIEALAKKTGEDRRWKRPPRLFVLVAEEGEGPGEACLGSLGEDEVRQYIGQVLGPIERLNSTATLLHRYSGGLPLLMVEGLRFMAAHIYRGEPLEKLMPPPGIGMLYEDKIKQLPDPSREILELLALLFRRVHVNTLSAIASLSPEKVIAAIEPCVREGLVERSSLPGGNVEYQMSNQALALDLTNRLSVTHKQWLHRKVAFGLEKGEDSTPGRIGYHMAKGGEWKRGKEYYKREAVRLKELGEFTGAAHYFVRALTLSPATFPEHQELAEEATRLLILTGDYQEANRYLQEVGETSHRREALRGFLAFKQRDYGSAQRAYERALELLPSSEKMDGIQYENALGNMALQRGDLSKAEEWFRKTLERERELSPQEVQKISNNSLGIVLARQGKIGESVDFYERRLTSLAPDQTSQEISLLSGLAYVLIQGSRFGEAISCLTRARELAGKRGEVHALFSILGNLVTALHKESRYADALSVLDEMIPLQERLGSRRDLAYNLLRQGDIYLVLGMEEAAHDCFERGSREAGEIQDRGLAGWFLLMESYWEREYGSPEKAEELIKKGVADAEKTGDTGLVMWTLYSLADLALENGNGEECRRLIGTLPMDSADEEFRSRVTLLEAWMTPKDKLQETADQFQKLEAVCVKNHYRELLWEIYHAWGKMKFATGHPGEASDLFRKGMDLLKEIASTLPEEYRDRYLKQPKRAALVRDFEAVKQMPFADQGTLSSAPFLSERPISKNKSQTVTSAPTLNTTERK